MIHDDDKPLTPAQARRKLQQGVAEYLAGNDQGPIVFRLKPTRKAGDRYPVKLTKQQRKSMIYCTRIRRKLKERLESAGDGIQIVSFIRKELDHLNDELEQSTLFAPGPDKKRLVAVLRRIANVIADDYAGVFSDEKPRVRKTTPKQGDLVYQFKITLLDIDPAIWRQIVVPDCTLVELHEFIQAAFGWDNYHLHEFLIDGIRYSEPALDGDDFGMEFEDETDIRLSKLLPKSRRKARWIYEYDFGDGWRHEIVFEGFPPNDPKLKYPLCLEGERACPPEDCGGPWGYADYLASIADPQHEEHEQMLEWRGSFDPEAFDVKKATKAMRKGNR